jgi:hypothetical protein
MCSCCYPEISPFLPVVQLCVSAQLWQALSASPAREPIASRCRQKGSIADDVIELHVAMLHRTQVSPPMVDLGHSRRIERTSSTSAIPPIATELLHCSEPLSFLNGKLWAT